MRLRWHFLAWGSAFKDLGKADPRALNYENFFYDNTWCWYLLPAMICVVVYVAVLSVLVFDEGKV